MIFYRSLKLFCHGVLKYFLEYVNQHDVALTACINYVWYLTLFLPANASKYAIITD